MISKMIGTRKIKNLRFFNMFDKDTFLNIFKFIALLFIFLSTPCFAFSSQGIILNEVMYHPCKDQGGNYNEWLELYNSANTTIDLSTFKIDNKDFDHYNISPKEYVVIAEKLTGKNSFESYYGNNDSVWNLTDANYTVLDSKSFSFSDTSDTINITAPNFTITFSYDDSMGADGDGETLEKIELSSNNNAINWERSYLKDGTPGRSNNIIKVKSTVADYSVLRITEFLPNPQGDDNSDKPDGEWVEIYNPSIYALDLAGMIIKDNSSKKIFITDTNTINNTIILPNSSKVIFPRSGKGIFNNQGIDYVMLADNKGNLIDKVSYSDPVEGNSFAKVNDLWQHTMPTPGYQNKDYSDIRSSVFNIEKIYDLGSDNKARFGETVRLKLNIYKGDETKNSISCWIEKEDGTDRISKYTKFNIYKKYTNSTLTVPVQIYPNCDNDYPDSNYSIKVGWTSGYKEKDSYDLIVRGISNDVCIGENKPKKEQKKKFIYYLDSFNSTIFPKQSFTTTLFLENNDNIAHDLEIYSYVYRGNKCYSGDREENKISLRLYAKDSRSIELKNLVEDIDPGDYKFKLRIKKDDQKTFNELTEIINVISSKKNTSSKDSLLSENKKESFGSYNASMVKSDPNVASDDFCITTVFESSTIKMSNLIPIFMLAAFTLLLTALIFIRL